MIPLPLLIACMRPVSQNGAPAGGASGATGHVVLRGGTVVGVGLADVEIADGRIAAVGTVAEGEQEVDVSGRFIVPAFIDSHVHLAYLPEAEEMADGGIAAAVDLAAPESVLSEPQGPVRVLWSGPMITAEGGYPTRSWGAGGYGIECADGEAAAAAVERLHGLGAGVIKIPVTTAPVLEEAARAVAAERAHALGLKVASHALADSEAASAAEAGADVLAHTPTSGLSQSTVMAWSGRTVISTLRAFGGSELVVANFAALRAAGATVLYGTDFGNTRTPGIDAEELRLLQSAGMDGTAILAAGTSVPAAYWGFAEHGAVVAGRAASLLVLPRDPLVDPLVLAEPEQVWIDGQMR